MKRKPSMIAYLSFAAMLVSFLIFPIAKASAESNAMWEQIYGGTEDDRPRYVIETADEGFAIAGTTYSFGAGSGDVWLIKTDGNGNMEWNQTYGGTMDDGARCLIQTSDGGYTTAGYTESLGAGGRDCWLIKTDGAGNMEWNQTYGGTMDDWTYFSIKTSDGGYALAGTTYSFGAGDCDCWLIKTGGDGNMEWNKTYGGTGWDRASCVVETSDGGYALSSYTESFGAGESDCWLIKTDGAGNMEWNKTYGGTMDDGAISMVKTSDGGYALTGDTDSFGAGGRDCWLVKTDGSGNMEWNKTYGGTGWDYPNSLVQTFDGGYAIAGMTESFATRVSDCWLVKIDGSGNLEWNKTYGGTEGENAWCVQQTSDGGYAIAAETWSFGLQDGVGDCDFWVGKTDEHGVIPEFPSWIILPLLMIATSIAIIVKKKVIWSTSLEC